MNTAIQAAFDHALLSNAAFTTFTGGVDLKTALTSEASSQRSPQGLREKHSLKQEAVALPLCKTRVITRATTLSNDENTRHRSKHNN